MDGGAWKAGGEAEQGGAVQACIDIPAPRRGRNPAGSWGTPESPGPGHCPEPIEASGRGDGRSCPPGRCPPCRGAGRHVPSCCRSQPKITTVPLPIRAAREACGLLLGSSSALQLEVREGGFSRGRAHPGVGVQGSQPPEDAAPAGAQGIACRAHVGVGCCGGADASKVLGSGRAGEGSSRRSPTPRTCLRCFPASPARGPAPGRGGVISTRPPTCNKSWPGTEGASCWTTWCGPRASCSGGGTAALKGWIWAEPGGWCWGQKQEAEPEGLQGGSGRPSPWCATAGREMLNGE